MLLQRIYVPLPDVEARKQILQRALKDKVPDLTDADFEDMAQRTDKLSAADMSYLAQQVANSTRRLLFKAMHFR